ncbi:MAG: hypothetical protein AAF696_35985, partial [Bacteroidota bacterium]
IKRSLPCSVNDDFGVFDRLIVYDLYSTLFNDYFRLHYRDLANVQQYICYDKKELASALIRAGEAHQDAYARVNKLFHTAHTSSQDLGETAGIIGPTEAISLNNYYKGSIFYFLDYGQCLQGCTTSPGPIPSPIPDDQSCPAGDISVVTYMIGTYGQHIYWASNRSYIVLKSACDPNYREEVELDMTAIEHTLSQAQWFDLVVGNLTEREYWNLYQFQIVPQLLINHPTIDVYDPCLIFNKAYFRTNFNAYGSYGYNIISVRGIGRINCTDLPALDG